MPSAGLVQLAGAVVLLGAGWPVTKYAVLSGAGSVWLGLGRAALSCVAAFLLLALLGRLRVPGRRDMPAVLALGLLQTGGFFLLSHAAVALVPAGRTAVLANATTVWLAPLALLLGEAVPRRQWWAAAFGSLGVVVLIGPWAFDWGDGRVLGGHALLLGAALAWSVAILVVRRRPPASPILELLPWCFGLAALVMLPAAALRPAGHWTGAAWAALAYVGLAGAVGTLCIIQATRLLPVMVASTGFLAGPAFGLLLSALWLGEPLTPDLLAGAGLVMGGVLMSALPSRRPA